MSSVLYKIFEIVLYFTILTQIGQLSLNIPAVYDVLALFLQTTRRTRGPPQAVTIRPLAETSGRICCVYSVLA